LSFQLAGRAVSNIIKDVHEDKIDTVETSKSFLPFQPFTDFCWSIDGFDFEATDLRGMLQHSRIAQLFTDDEVDDLVDDVAETKIDLVARGVPALPRAMTDAIIAYTHGGLFHRRVNSDLRDMQKIEVGDAARLRIDEVYTCWRQYMHALTCGLSYLPVVTGIVYRGLAIHPDVIKEEHTEGRLLRWNAFTSTSLSFARAFYHAARDSLGKDGGGGRVFNVVVWELTVRMGVDIANYSQFPEEEEVLLRLGTMFLVGKHKKTLEKVDACLR
jgi:hypothetical protein